MNNRGMGTGRDTFHEGAEELKEKLRSDLSHWGQARRYVSLKPVMPCSTCEGTGRVACPTCEGIGRPKIVFEEKQELCPTCNGAGVVTCVLCSGHGQVPNAHRKKILWLLAIGGAAWLYVLFRLWGGDVAPALRANISGGGGSSVSRAAPPGN